MNVVKDHFLELIRQVFPASNRSRENLGDLASTSDPAVRRGITRVFSGIRWNELDLAELYGVFKEDSALAVYCLPVEERTLFLPSIMSHYFVERIDVPGFDYVLENVLLGGDVEGLSGVSRNITREQLALSSAILMYVSTKQWQFPGLRKIDDLRRAVEGS